MKLFTCLQVRILRFWKLRLHTLHRLFQLFYCVWLSFRLSRESVKHTLHISFFQLTWPERLLQLMNLSLKLLRSGIRLLLSFPLKLLNSFFFLSQLGDETVQLLLLLHVLVVLFLSFHNVLVFQLLELFTQRLTLFLSKPCFQLVVLALLMVFHQFLQLVNQLSLVNLKHWNLPPERLILTRIVY